MKYFKLLFGLIFVLNIALAQNTISGTLSAPNPQGFIVIGCLLDFTTQDCDYEKSQYAEVSANGLYTLTNLEVGQYLVIAWRDTNNSGDIEEGQDELGYYTDASGELAVVAAPATNINISMATASNPLTTTPTATHSSNGLVGTWSNTNTTGVEFYDSSTGSWADLSGNASEFTFNADGTCEIYGLLQSSLYSSSIKIFVVTTGTYAFDGSTLSVTSTTHERSWSQDELTKDETRPFSNTYQVAFTDSNTLVLDGDLTLSRRPQ